MKVSDHCPWRGGSLVWTVSTILLLSCSGKSGSKPSELISIPGDLRKIDLAASGIYADGWTGEHVSLNLQQAPRQNALTVRGTLPKIYDPHFHTEADVRVDNRSLAHQTLGIGEFQFSVPVAEEAGKRHVEINFSSVQPLPNGDGRSVGVKLQSIGFETIRDGEVQSQDIVEGSGIELGSAWGERESFHNETFRWVDNDAEFQLTPATSGEEQVTLFLEPGPGIAAPFLLKVLDQSGRQIDAVRVSRRENAELFLPTEAGKINQFRLHVDGGGKRIPSDPRILNFRVFRVSAKPIQK